MRKLLSTIIAVFALGILTASAQKIGHIDYAKVLDTTQTYKLAIQKGEEVQKSFEETMLALQQDYQTKLEKYQAEAETLSPVIRQLREQELVQIQQTSEQLQAELQNNQQILNQRYFVPLEEWLKEAVGIIGKSKGLDYIMYYEEQNSIFWVNPDKATDVTVEVMKEVLRIEKEKGVPGE